MQKLKTERAFNSYKLQRATSVSWALLEYARAGSACEFAMAKRHKATLLKNGRRVLYLLQTKYNWQYKTLLAKPFVMQKFPLSARDIIQCRMVHTLNFIFSM